MSTNEQLVEIANDASDLPELGTININSIVLVLSNGNTFCVTPTEENIYERGGCWAYEEHDEGGEGGGGNRFTVYCFFPDGECRSWAYDGATLLGRAAEEPTPLRQEPPTRLASSKNLVVAYNSKLIAVFRRVGPRLEKIFRQEARIYVTDHCFENVWLTHEGVLSYTITSYSGWAGGARQVSSVMSITVTF